jgi:hypothetical protein
VYSFLCLGDLNTALPEDFVGINLQLIPSAGAPMRYPVAHNPNEVMRQSAENTTYVISGLECRFDRFVYGFRRFLNRVSRICIDGPDQLAINALARIRR